jgi:hypothetical protein
VDLGIGRMAVDDQEDGLVGAGDGQTVEKVAQGAIGRQRQPEEPLEPLRRPSLQGGVQVDGDYQLKMLSRSDSDVS